MDHFQAKLHFDDGLTEENPNIYILTGERYIQ